MKSLFPIFAGVHKFFIWAVLWFLPSVASAHEAYVLDKNYFWQELKQPYSTKAFDALKNPHNLYITAYIVCGVLALLMANFFFRESVFGSKFHSYVERFSVYGPLFVRAAISASFFFSALSWSFLGPELSLRALPFAAGIRWALFAASIMIAAGFFTEIAALFSFLIFTIGLFEFGAYIFTYLNYLGEIIVLCLFGMRHWSLDGIIFGPRVLWKEWEKYGTTVVRIFYGMALAYAGVTVKFLHPDLTVKVVKDWNLTQFHWLFPSDPLLVTLGAGLAELAIGLFIIFGFEMRITVFISLIYITLSLLYFRELVWPHLMLYGISLNLIVQPEVFTVDHLLFFRKRINWWKRPFLPHKNSHQA